MGLGRTIAAGQRLRTRLSSLRDELRAPATPSNTETSNRDVAEDARLRSDYVRELIHQPVLLDTPCGAMPGIPKVLVQFWHDKDAVPEDVRDCMKSWDELINQGFRRILFGGNEARSFIERHFGDQHVAAFDRCHHPAMSCDYFRLCYLFRHGGFYVDADDEFKGAECEYLFRDNRLKIQPLCFDSATRTMVGKEIFMRKRARSSHWIYYANNNPIITPPSHPIVALALARATRILLDSHEERPEIQFTTGPLNLTVSLVSHSIASKLVGKPRDFEFLPAWETIATSRWSLSYRNDERNWRLWQFLNAGGLPN